MGVDLVHAFGPCGVFRFVREERNSPRFISLSGRADFHPVVVPGGFRVLRSSSFDIRTSAIGAGVGEIVVGGFAGRGPDGFGHFVCVVWGGTDSGAQDFAVGEEDGW